METTYETDAQEVLNKMGVKFQARFVEWGRHFETDKENRNIWNVQLSRNGQRISFKFGQSIHDSAIQPRKEPTAYELLACITKSDPDTFENFCGDFGYDADTKHAQKIYRAVIREWQKVERFFSADEIEALQEIN